MSILSQAITGKRIKPFSVLIYGVHGIGKTSLPSESDNPIYVGSEENDEIDCARLPKITSWKQLREQLQALKDESHDYKTLVIDTIDALEQVAQKEILTGPEKSKTMATAMGGFGKAYEKMSKMFIEIRDQFLVPLREQKSMNIVILAHAEKTKHEDPMTLTSYDHYTTAMHKKVKPIFEDWVSAILFINHWRAKTSLNDGREVAVGDGSRMIFTEERPSHVAKNRFELPYEIEFKKTGTWKLLSDLIKKHYGNVEQKPIETKDDKNEVTQMLKSIEELFARVPEDQQPLIQTSLKRAKNDLKELTRIHSKMQKLIK